MTYDEATRHATWEESFVYALGYSVEDADPAWRRLGGLGFRVMKYALSRELTLVRAMTGKDWDRAFGASEAVARYIMDNPPRFQGARGLVAAVSAPSERACSRAAEACEHPRAMGRSYGGLNAVLAYYDKQSSCLDPPSLWGQSP